MTSGRRGVRLARGLLVAAVALIALTWFVGFVAAPGFMGGGMYEPTWQQQVLAALPYGAAIVAQALGLALMIRLSPAHREAEPDGWRYRDLD